MAGLKAPPAPKLTGGAVWAGALSGGAKAPKAAVPKAAVPKAPKLTGAAKEKAQMAPPKSLPPAFAAPKAPKAPKPAPYLSLAPQSYTHSLTKAATVLGAHLAPGTPYLGTPAQHAAAGATRLKNLSPDKLLTWDAAHPQQHPGLLSGLGVPGKLVEQIGALPKTMGEGGLAVLGAVGHDELHPVQTFEHPLQSQTFKLGSEWVTKDPVLKSIEQLSPAPALANPLGTIMDATIVGGAASKLAEAGALGDTAASAFERPDVTVPGTNTTLLRPNYSLNPLVHGGQRIADWRAANGYGRGLLPSDTAANTQEISALKGRVDQDNHTSQTAIRNAMQANDTSVAAADSHVAGVKGIKGLVKGSVEPVTGGQDLIGHFQQLLPHDPATARLMMRKQLAMWKDSLAKHEAAKGDVSAGGHLQDASEVENLHKNIAAMELHNKLSDTDLQKVIAAAKERQNFERSVIQPARIESALNPEQQMERRGVLPYARGYMDAKRVTAEDKYRSDAGVQQDEVGHQLTEAQAELKALVASKHDVPMRDIHPDLKPAAKNVKSAEADLTKARNTGTPRDKLTPLRQARDKARLAFQAQRQDLRTKAAATVDGLKNQQDALAGKQRYLHGWVVPVEHGPTGEALRQSIANDEPIHGLSPLNKDYEMLNTDAALLHAEANHITPGYLSGSHAQDESMQTMHGRDTGSTKSVGRGGTSNPYLGESYTRGTYDGTLKGSHDSAVASLRAVTRANDHDRLLHNFGINDPATGGLSTFSHDAQGLADAKAAARDFKDAHPGQPLAIVPRYPDRAGNVTAIDDKQGITEDPANRLALVHKNALDRFARHEKMRYSVPVAGALNRVWRGGVLGLSGNYMQSVPEEGFLRTGFAGINPLRTLPGFGTHILKPTHFNDLMDGLKAASTDTTLDSATRAMAKENHDLFTGLSSGGTNIGQQGMELRDAMQDPSTSGSKAVKAGRTLEHYVFKPGQFTMKNIGRLENLQTRAVFNDWTKDMVKTVGSQEALVKALSDGKNGANLAAAAAKRMTDVLGNYVHRSPTEQFMIRNFTPFLPWYKNAVKFVYATMPRDHPVLQGFLTNVGQANAQAWANNHANLASYLSTDFLGTKWGNALETVDGSDPMRNTPFGVGETNGPLGDTMSLFEPSVMPAFLGALGLNGFGQPLKTNTYGVNVQSGSTQAAKQGLLSNILESLPYASPIRKAIEVLDPKGVTIGGVEIVPPLAKDAELSHNKALAIIENAFGGSWQPKNYGVYGTSGGSTAGEPPGLSGSSGLPPGLGSSSGAPPGA